MDQLAQMLAQRFNLSPEVSQQIVQFVFDHVKSKLPEGLGSQLEGLMGQGGATAEGGGGLMDKLKTMGAGMMGNE
jgi:hypothetical protein